MDLSLITIAQVNAANRLAFDPDAFDHSVRRTEEHKAKLRALWTRCCAQVGVATNDLRMITKIASAQRAG